MNEPRLCAYVMQNGEKCGQVLYHERHISYHLFWPEVSPSEPEVGSRCSAESPHAAHTFGGRPMQLCKGIPKPDCDNSLRMPTGQCALCMAYHPEAVAPEPKPGWKTCSQHGYGIPCPLCNPPSMPASVEAETSEPTTPGKDESNPPLRAGMTEEAHARVSNLLLDVIEGWRERAEIAEAKLAEPASVEAPCSLCMGSKILREEIREELEAKCTTEKTVNVAAVATSAYGSKAKLVSVEAFMSAVQFYQAWKVDHPWNPTKSPYLEMLELAEAYKNAALQHERRGK